jgi:hypothetical protein
MAVMAQGRIAGLIELVFESVPSPALNALLAHIIGAAYPIEITHSELGAIDAGGGTIDYLRLAATSEEPASVFIKVPDLAIGSASVARPLIQILSADGTMDVVLSLSCCDIADDQRPTFADSLKEAAVELAERNGIISFHCGLEPAADLATRLFTGAVSGPIMSI